MSREIVNEVEQSFHDNIHEVSENHLSQMAGWAESGLIGEVAGFSANSSLTISDTISMTTSPSILGNSKFSDLMWADLCANPRKI